MSSVAIGRRWPTICSWVERSKTVFRPSQVSTEYKTYRESSYIQIIVFISTLSSWMEGIVVQEEWRSLNVQEINGELSLININ